MSYAGPSFSRSDNKEWFIVNILGNLLTSFAFTVAKFGPDNIGLKTGRLVNAVLWFADFRDGDRLWCTSCIMLEAAEWCDLSPCEWLSESLNLSHAPVKSRFSSPSFPEVKVLPFGTLAICAPFISVFGRNICFLVTIPWAFGENWILRGWCRFYLVAGRELCSNTMGYNGYWLPEKSCSTVS